MRLRYFQPGCEILTTRTVESVLIRNRGRHITLLLDLLTLVFETICPPAPLAPTLRQKHANELNYRRSDGHEEDGYQDEYDQGRDHLNSGFCGLLLRSLAAFGAQRIGVHTPRLRYAGTKSIGLYQRRYQGANIVNSGANHQISQCLSTRLAGAHLQCQQMKYIAQVGVRRTQVLADAHHGLIQCKSGFHADNGEVESIGQRQADAKLPILDHAFQYETRDKKTQGRNSNHETREVEAGSRQHNRRQPHQAQ